MYKFWKNLTKSTMNYYDEIIEDLQRETPTRPTITPPFYNDNDPIEIRIRSLVRQMRRAKGQRNRVDTLLVAYYMGQILEVETNTHGERMRCLEILSAHYAKAARWVYYLFEFLGPDQIARTRYLTLTILTSKLGLKKYEKLKQEAAAIAGARFREEEVVNG